MMVPMQYKSHRVAAHAGKKLPTMMETGRDDERITTEMETGDGHEWHGKRRLVWYQGCSSRTWKHSRAKILPGPLPEPERYRLTSMDEIYSCLN